MIKIRIAIADDSEILRTSISNTLKQEKDLDVVLQATNGKELLESLEKSQPDIVLMDIRMPEMDGIEAAKAIKEKFPKIKVIAFSLYDIESNIIKMNINGVKSFIGKEDGTSELLKAIRIVSQGGVYMTDYAANVIQNHLRKNSINPQCQIELTEMETTLLIGICKGRSSTELAKALNKSPRTIEDYRLILYKKFQVENKEQLIVKAIAMKAISSIPDLEIMN